MAEDKEVTSPTTEQDLSFDPALKKKKKKKAVAFSEDPLGADADLEPTAAPVPKVDEEPAAEDVNMFEGMKKKKKKKASLPDAAEEPVIAGATEPVPAPAETNGDMDAEAALFDGIKKKKKKKAIPGDLGDDVVSPDPPEDEAPIESQTRIGEELATVEEGSMFDGVKKKKKKKEIPMDLGEDSTIADAPIPEPTNDAEPVNGSVEPAADEDNMFADIKKKKKKKEIPLDLGEDFTAAPSPDAAPATEESAAGDFDFSDIKKKKKKSTKKTLDLEAFERELDEANAAAAAQAVPEKKAKKPKAEDGEEDEEEDDDAEVDGDLGDDIFAHDEGSDAEGDEKWQGTDRDYTYNELLGRFFRVLRAQNPELAGEKRRYTIAPPSVFRDGNKKTIFANIVDIAKRMHRQPDHVISFLFAELGTTGSVDGSSRLVIKGRFQQKQLENVLRRYIVEYVTCKTCKSPETLLSKDNRIYFVNCESCGSRRSVSAVKAGFQAQVGKRSRTKAAT